MNTKFTEEATSSETVQVYENFFFSQVCILCKHTSYTFIPEILLAFCNYIHLKWMKEEDAHVHAVSFLWNYAFTCELTCVMIRATENEWMRKRRRLAGEWVWKEEGDQEKTTRKIYNMIWSDYVYMGSCDGTASLVASNELMAPSDKPFCQQTILCQRFCVGMLLKVIPKKK